MPSRPSGPLLAFRIADDRFPLLDGTGAFRTGGRWNSRGRRVIYAGLGFSVALLEKLVRTRIGSVPSGQQFAEILIPGHVPIEQVGPEDVPGWDAPGYGASQAYGDPWYDSGRTAVLIVPSLPAMGYDRNVLINQMHPAFSELRTSQPRPMIWDARLFGGR
ncbi:RES family NAD+ phosphorylase [Siccirubricoccus sp. G192]|uniref:RES family NAD+ phosphorylase n=1 Tax=Siccirubricoccus sp. G192 TaxID=2849651 RepID=UPI001C2C2078|nr:RES domain-containing protein [Siccirubricoccus sp. G192]MBV1800464.1 RES domain-containing protein [Siccirubricoccus sp. G192]